MLVFLNYAKNYASTIYQSLAEAKPAKLYLRHAYLHIEPQASSKVY